MKKSFPLIMLMVMVLSGSYAQVAINQSNTSPDNSAMLDISSTTKGLLIPRLTTGDRIAITDPATGLMVYDNEANAFFYYDGLAWTRFGVGINPWELQGNNVIVFDTNFQIGIGTYSPAGKFEVCTIFHTETYGEDQCIGGVASASSVFTTYAADRAFDDNYPTEWVSDEEIPAWLQYDFGEENQKRIAKYRIYFSHITSYDHSPEDWTFEGSHDGMEWIMLNAQSSQSWTADEWKEYTCLNTEYFRYYRINISDNQSVEDNYVQINEMEMMEENLSSHHSLLVKDNKVGLGTANPMATLDINGTFKYADGNEGSGKILASDPSGMANWVESALLGSGGWTVDGSYVYNTGYYVGIGTATPAATLDVHGRIIQTGTGHSVFLGEGAGANDDLSDNQNAFLGYQAGNGNISGSNNTAIGTAALYLNTDRSNLVALGDSAMFYNGLNAPSYWEATGNTAIGSKALFFNTSGYENTASGFEALYSNSSGYDNTANGFKALHNNSTGTSNTAFGRSALFSNWDGYQNTAIGNYALYTNTSGSFNIAIGLDALYSNTTGLLNTAAGYHTLYNNSTGFSNIAIGPYALNENTTRSNLVAIGDSALFHNGEGAVDSLHATGNTAVGSKALYSNTGGFFNTALGYQALYSNTWNNGNTATGYQALYSDVGAGNTAQGSQALYSNYGGYENTAQGYQALYSNLSGTQNTATGYQALYSHKSFSRNTATGYQALFSDTTGAYNTATGFQALYHNTNGGYNVASGHKALYKNETGYINIAIGSDALYENDTGYSNVAVGYATLYYNQDSYNTACGTQALYHNSSGSYNTACGFKALYTNYTGVYNTGIGWYARGADTNCTALGCNAYAPKNSVRIGNSSVTSIGGFAAWTNFSDARGKTDVRENVIGLDFILKLRPVTYHLDMDAIAAFNELPDSVRLYSSERLKARELQIGFIAQEVEQAADELGFDFHGVDKPKKENLPYGLRYSEFVVPLVKAVQEQQGQIEEQKKINEEQRKMIEDLQAEVRELKDRAIY